MTHYLLTNYLIIVAAVILGVFVFLKDRHSLIYRTFLLLNLSLAVWSFGFIETVTATSREIALFWGRALYLGAIFIPTFFLHFILAFLKEAERQKRLLLFMYIISGLFLIINFTPLLIKDVTPLAPFRYYDVPGRLYPFFVLYFFALVIYAHSRLIKALLTSFGNKRNQIKYILFSSILAFSGGTFAFFPIYGLEIPPIGNYLIALYPLLITYAVIKHRLMDINIVFKRGTINIFLFSLIFIPSLLMGIFFEKLLLGYINIPLTFVISLLYLTGIYLAPKIKPQIEEVVDRVIFKERYLYQKTLQEFSRVMVSILDLKQLCQKIIDTLTEDMDIESASLFLLDEEKGWYYPAVCVGLDCEKVKKFALSKEEFFTVRLKKTRDIIIKEELRAHEKVYIATMEMMNAEISIPLLLQNELIGIINLGQKTSGDMYNREDLDLLKTLANQATIAIENAKMYDALRKTKVRMQRADRLAALGTLTAGLAHEIRNPLVAVKTFLQLLPEKFDDEEFRNYFLSVASSEVERISSLVTELLDFARPSEPQLKEEDINEIIERMITLVSTEAKKKSLKITQNLSDNLPLIQVDKDQIKQVFLNILLNAVQATPENGEIFITTRFFTRKSDETFIQIEIRDTGPGIPPQELEHIFTPFYTTKAQGSGLGLSISNQIVEEHHGYIEVESQVGSGTAFIVNLPLNPNSRDKKDKEARIL